MADQFVIAPTFQEGFKFTKADPKWTILNPDNPCALGTLKKSDCAVVRIMNVQFPPEWLHEVMEYMTETNGSFSIEIEE